MKSISLIQRWHLRLLFLVLVGTCAAQVSAQIVEIEQLRHACNGNNGSVTVAITEGEPEDYFYVWPHSGETSLSQFNLAPGIYTFYIESEYGCREELEVEILDFSACTSTYCTRYVEEECTFIVGVNIFNGDGDFIDPSYVDIRWDVEGQAGRFIEVDVSANGRAQVCYEYDILNGGGSTCCFEEICFDLEKPADAPDCRLVEPCRVIINEIVQYPGESFVELLVTGGSAACNTGCDLRNLIIDDNNGSLLLSEAYGDPTTRQAIDGSYIRLKGIDNWESVPVGAFIVIFGDKGAANFISDAQDTDGDGVYGLWAGDAGYLAGYTGGTPLGDYGYEYDGFPLSFSDWKFVEPGPVGSDGFQVRDADAALHQALSFVGLGLQARTASGVLEVFTGFDGTLVSQLVGTDYDAAASYLSFATSDGSEGTPGLPNSPDNELAIRLLRECGGSALQSMDTKMGTAEIGDQFSFSVQPNPARDLVQVNIYSSFNGPGRIRLADLNGRLVLEQSIEVVAGKTTFSLGADFAALGEGVYLLQVTGPTGRTLNEKIVKVGAGS